MLCDISKSLHLIQQTFVEKENKTFSEKNYNSVDEDESIYAIKTENSLFVREIVSRVLYVALLILAPLASGIDVAVVLGHLAVSFVTIGKIDLLKSKSSKYYFAITGLPKVAYKIFLKIINPHSQIIDAPPLKKNQVKHSFMFYRMEEPRDYYPIAATGQGFVASFFPPLAEKIDSQFKFSDSMIVRQLFTRINYGILVIVCVVARFFDAIISVPAVIGSFITLGKITTLNNLAYRSIQYFDLFFDICIYATKILNPKIDLNPIEDLYKLN